MLDVVPTVFTFQPALPMRGVTVLHRTLLRNRLFQPALPMRGVTEPAKLWRQDTRISTRTPHAGSDQAEKCISGLRGNFNPHSPCGE